MDRRYRETRNSDPGTEEASEALAARSRSQARRRARGVLAKDRGGRRSSQTGAESQVRKAEAGRSQAAVFEEYGSGGLGSGDASLDQLRKEIYFRPDPREL